MHSDLEIASKPPNGYTDGQNRGSSGECRFDGGLISSDGGLVLLREEERRIGLADLLASCLGLATSSGPYPPRPKGEAINRSYRVSDTYKKFP